MHHATFASFDRGKKKRIKQLRIFVSDERAVIRSHVALQCPRIRTRVLPHTYDYVDSESIFHLFLDISVAYRAPLIARFLHSCNSYFYHHYRYSITVANITVDLYLLQDTETRAERLPNFRLSSSKISIKFKLNWRDIHHVKDDNDKYL